MSLPKLNSLVAAQDEGAPPIVLAGALRRS